MMSCRRARAVLVEHVRGGVGEPTLLQLDRHLADCADCRAERARWETMSSLRRVASPSLGAAARERIVARLRQGPLDEDELPRPAAAVRRPWVMAFGAAAAAAALLVGSWIATHRHPGAPATTTAQLEPRSLPEPAPDRRDSVRFAGAELRYGNDARVQLHPAAREIAIDVGTVELTAAETAPLRIVAPRFTVIVRQAHVVFAPDVVRVLDGTVEVYASDNRLLATLPAGGEWRPSALPPLPAPSVAPTTTATTATPSPSTIDTHGALDRARAALARGDSTGARAILSRLLHSRPALADRAQAQLFVAESYLVESDSDRAVRAYFDVAHTYPTLAAGEAASFAAAQLLWERGRRAESATALREYLARYPDGRFARETRERLAGLAPPAQ